MRVTSEQLLLAKGRGAVTHLIPRSDEDYVDLAYWAYNNPQCSGIEEFRADLNRADYIARMLKRYVLTGELNTRLILNNMIVFFNLFGSDGASLLFSRVDASEYSALTTLMKFLSRYPPGGLASLGADVGEPQTDKRVEDNLLETIHV